MKIYQNWNTGEYFDESELDYGYYEKIRDGDQLVQIRKGLEEGIYIKRYKDEYIPENRIDFAYTSEERDAMSVCEFVRMENEFLREHAGDRRKYFNLFAITIPPSEYDEIKRELKRRKRNEEL